MKINPTCSYDFCKLDITEWGDEQQKVMDEIQQKHGVFTKPTYVPFHEDEYPKMRLNAVRNHFYILHKNNPYKSLNPHSFMAEIKIGIIGGSGMDDPNLLQDYQEKEVKTNYGSPSSKIICGKISGVNVCILARHGKTHEIPPSQINFQANIAALKILGCTHILATSAVGSLKQEIMPGDLVFPNQFIDFTKTRKNTFYDRVGEVVHTPMSEPFSEPLRKMLIENADKLGFRNHKKATLVVIEGPRFSTKSESLMFKIFADIIGMTTVPECILAREAGIEYASIAMSTDYDCWKENEEPVTFDMVKKRMAENAEKVKKLIIMTIQKIGEMNEHKEDKEFINKKS